MGDLGAAFVDVSSSGSDLLANFTRGIETLGRGVLSGRPGGTLFLPPGTWEIDLRAAPGGRLVIPANIELWFAPGARLRVASGTLVVRGPFRAGLHPVFFDDPTGQVAFGADAVDEIHPEWWGPDAWDDPLDETALQRACDCAYYSGLEGNSLAAVRFTRRIVLRRAVRLRRASIDEDARGVAPLANLTLRGRSAPRWGAPSGEVPVEPDITVLAGFSGVELLSFDGPVRLRLENLDLDAAGAAFYCVTLRVQPENTVFDRVEMFGCTFRGALKTHVRCERQGFPIDGKPLPNGSTPPELNVSVRGCRFDADQPTVQSAVLVAAQECKVALTGCSFDGRADAFVVATKTRIDVNACVFHNGASPVLSQGSVPADLFPSRGVDVLLQDDTGRNLYLPGDSVASVRARLCHSTSSLFLQRADARFFGGASPRPGETLLVHVTHAPGVSSIASVYWEGQANGAGQCFAPLTLVGCTFP